MEKIITFSDEQLKIIRETKCPKGIPDMEFKRFIHRAETTGLDPLADQIHLQIRHKKEKQNGQDVWVATYQIIVGIDGFRAYADRTGKLSGIKRGVTLDDKGKLLSAWAEIHRKDWEFPAHNVVYYDEYVQTDRQGNISPMWRKMPKNQLMKCAEAAAHRMAFPYLAGIYEAAELEQMDNPESETTTGKPKNLTKPTSEPKPDQGPESKQESALPPETKPEPEPKAPPEPEEALEPEPKSKAEPKLKPEAPPESAEPVEKPDGFKFIALKTGKSRTGIPFAKIVAENGDKQIVLLARGEEGLAEVAKLKPGCYFKAKTFEEAGFTFVSELEIAS